MIYKLYLSFRYWWMSLFGYQGAFYWVDYSSVGRRWKKIKWVKFVPIALTLDDTSNASTRYFYSVTEMKNNFHNSANCYTDRERDN